MIQIKNEFFELCGKKIIPGQKIKFLYDFSSLFTRRKLKIPIHVFHGLNPGPKLFIFSTLHGDELNGIEIVNRLHKHAALEQLSGTLITVPVANPYGLMLQTRNIKNRDLNRSFPGGENGSLASRLTYFYTNEIVKKCHYGIDLHSGGRCLFNFPHVRISKSSDAKTLAKEFGVPILGTPVPNKSLRKIALEQHIPLLVFEGGEAQRLNEDCIEIGLQGILNILSHLNMIGPEWKTLNTFFSQYYSATKWIRAPVSGLLKTNKNLISSIIKDQILAELSDPFDIEKPINVLATCDGIIFAKTTEPMVNEGDPLFHVCMR
ncbi:MULTISPECIES: succinylglutamate desuccinylase/aspartoacylase family protein [Legionella]|uniref:Succinylglutamate desuccinylase/aspartoacylase family protein n=1 Tax=Legionella septentrionalis TaxID=2498109 RepID=A0A3S0XT37_9GAMM|nr:MULTISPECIES: succinylglutamate desuccinylase/aspartoacylase family protein [Legionella]MCP0913224.1 succinylglutamate desuccinylase/aspartoacylase family protein [Legionella sp. 27cVA30]RUQ88020.1 succinylglutamate desuccinylase/aspartoacylase family protein [Legionella septentrionalis]RUR10342.1 succinylglutamate desuccinylase/aspartoacylase family protein [Legionella septentrionalis]RUR17056.1 succinylglutamate desuccinylase/aspartoacylase family protein [Legionella septentrionalis]